MAKRIVVIDDSLTVRKILETGLGRAGYVTICYADPAEALRNLLDPGNPAPDLLLVDIGLPKLDGFEVLKYMRANWRYSSVPMYVISNRDSVLDRVKARLVGANGYIVKPFKIQEVVALLQQLF
jgi:twitching motility two-component system response regulator PilG